MLLELFHPLTMMLMITLISLFGQLDDDDDADDNNKPVWPSWAVGVLSGVQETETIQLQTPVIIEVSPLFE
jgi:hypothetical protein